MAVFVKGLLALTLAGSAAALGAWLVCLLLHRLHAPRWLSCLLWIAVGARFALPLKLYVTLPRPTNPAAAAAADRLQNFQNGA